MQAQAEQRLTELRAEFQAGQKMLADLEAREAELRQTMLRISGAIQVLEELLAGEDTGDMTGEMTGHITVNGSTPAA